MRYEEFVRRFGASVRTKHLLLPGSDLGDRTANKRPYVLPERSELPPEFIRLEPWEAEYLFRLAERARYGIVETGRFHGGSTFVLACACPQHPIWSIDLAPQDDARLRRVLEECGVGSKVDLIVGDSGRTRYEQIKAFDLLFIDGDHSYDGCMNDLTNWFGDLQRGGHVVLHDSYPGQPVMDAAADFCRDHNVEVIVPAFRTGQHWWHPAGSIAHFVKK